METYLFNVLDTFYIKSTGLILTPGVSINITVKIGDKIKLVKPNGDIITTTIKSFPMICPFDPDRGVPIGLDKSFTKDTVPIGTRVLLLADVK